MKLVLRFKKNDMWRQLLLLALSICVLLSTVLPVLAEESFVYVSDLDCTYWQMYISSSDNPDSPYHPSYDCNEAGGALSIAGVIYEKGIRTHPDSEAPAIQEYNISGLPYRYFSAVVGKDSAGGAGLVQFVVEVDGEVRYTSDELNFNETEFIECNIEGGTTLGLYVYNVDGCSFDSSAWGDAKLSVDHVKQTEPTIVDAYDPERDDYRDEYVSPYTGEESEVFVSDLKWKNWCMFSAHSGQASPAYRPSFDCNESGTTIRINGVEYEKGIRTHPDWTGPSDIVFDISAYSDKYTSFSATVGRDSGSQGGGFVKFIVLVDGNVVAESPELTLDEDYEINADIRGGSILTLRVDPTEDGCHHDSSAWGNAKLCVNTISEIRLKDMPFKVRYKLGETLDISGLTIEAVYENGSVSTPKVTTDMVSGFDSSSVGTQTLTISFNGMTATYDVVIFDSTEAPTEKPTEPATETIAPTESNNDDTPSGGCSSVLSGSVLMFVILACGLVILQNKRRIL